MSVSGTVSQSLQGSIRMNQKNLAKYSRNLHNTSILQTTGKEAQTSLTTRRARYPEEMITLDLGTASRVSQITAVEEWETVEGSLEDSSSLHKTRNLQIKNTWKNQPSPKTALPQWNSWTIFDKFNARPGDKKHKNNLLLAQILLKPSLESYRSKSTADKNKPKRPNWRVFMTPTLCNILVVLRKTILFLSTAANLLT